jgi:siroheme synthase
VQAASSAGERRVATRLCDLQTAIAAEQLGSPCVMIIGDAMMQVLQDWTPVENPAGVQSATGALGKAA